MPLCRDYSMRIIIYQLAAIFQALSEKFLVCVELLMSYYLSENFANFDWQTRKQLGDVRKFFIKTEPVSGRIRIPV